MAGTQPSSEHHSGAAAEHVNNTAGCVLVKRGNFGWEMWGPEQDARVSSITVSGYKHLEGKQTRSGAADKIRKKIGKQYPGTAGSNTPSQAGARARPEPLAALSQGSQGAH